MPRRPEPGRVLATIFLILLGLGIAFVGGSWVVGWAVVLHQWYGADAQLATFGVAMLIFSALFGGLGILCVEHGVRLGWKRGAEDGKEGSDP